ncbi:MAG: DUF3515 family protein [Microbacteriaceae bacterium]
MSSRRRTASLALVLAATATALTACAPIVPLEPAADANNPVCADVTVRLPDEIQSQPKRETNAQATGAWGDPENILLRCGVEVPAPSTLPCVPIDGIFWLRNDDDAPNFVFTTFGREPAVQVAIDNDQVSAGIVLGSLSTAVATTVPNGLECRDVEDTVTGEPGPGDE